MRQTFLGCFIIILCLKSIQNSNPVFSCNFDDGNCPNGVFNFNQSSYYVSITDTQLISGTPYRLTDVTSIITPTNNGKVCDLPFTEFNYEYNHCYSYAGKYGCPTVEGGGRGDCNLGKFVLGKTASNGLPISIKGTSSEITLPNSGIYELSFYVLMFTNITDMTFGDDFIQVSVDSVLNPSQSIKSEKYDYKNIGKANVWEKKSFLFDSTEEKIIIRVEFVRSNNAAKGGYFGFDQFEIFTATSMTTTTISPTTTTLTTTTSPATTTSTTATTTTTTTTTTPPATTTTPTTSSTTTSSTSPSTTSTTTTTPTTSSTTTSSTSTSTTTSLTRTTPTTTTSTTTTSTSTTSTTTTPPATLTTPTNSTTTTTSSTSTSITTSLTTTTLITNTTTTTTSTTSTTTTTPTTSSTTTSSTSPSTPSTTTTFSPPLSIPFLSCFFSMNNCSFEFSKGNSTNFFNLTKVLFISEVNLNMSSYLDNGKFLAATSPEDGSQYSSSVKFNVYFDVTGKYRIQFSSFIFCFDTNCSKASDYLKIIQRFKTKNNLSKEIIIADLKLNHTLEKTWNKYSSQLYILNEESKNFSIIAEMGRKMKFEAKSYIGIDNLEFFYLDSDENVDGNADNLNIGALIGGLLSTIILISIIAFIIRKKIFLDKKKYEKKEYIDDKFADIQLELKSSPSDNLNQVEP